MTDPFPLGLARGDAFCDREPEREALAARLAAGRHTWLSAPRRYGKSSLLHRSLEDATRGRTRVRGAIVDLLPTYDRASAEAAILAGVGVLSGDLLPAHRRAFEVLSRLFAGLRPEVSVDEGGLRVRLRAEAGPPEGLRLALLGLDALARERQIRVVLVLDEFQRLRQIAGHEAVEGAIRHAAERTRAGSYVFSGSHRHLLEQQFEDPAAPLYRLCRPLHLGRIPAEAYRAHLAALARRRWRRRLPDPVIERILALTERHPYHVNALCDALWGRETMPDAAGVDETWDDLVRGQQAQYQALVEPLTANQLAFLHALARRPTEQAQSRAFLAETGLASSSAAKVRRDLAARDLVDVDDDGRLRVLDPGLAHYLRQERASRLG